MAPNHAALLQVLHHIANYMNGLVSITSYCYANLEPEESLLDMNPNPLTQLINLRGQAEKASKTQQMYEKRIGGWLEWEDVQKARVTATKKLDDAAQGGTPASKRNLLRDCCALSLLSLIPPDRVGCIRKLRLGHTLKKKESGDWMIDLSKQRDGHKTSRFYGPFAASLPVQLTPILDRYSQIFSCEFGGDTAYIFHPPQSGFDRPMEGSAWSQWVGRLCSSGTPTSPSRRKRSARSSSLGFAPTPARRRSSSRRRTPRSTARRARPPMTTTSRRMTVW